MGIGVASYATQASMPLEQGGNMEGHAPPEHAHQHQSRTPTPDKKRVMITAGSEEQQELKPKLSNDTQPGSRAAASHKHTLMRSLKSVHVPHISSKRSVTIEGLDGKPVGHGTAHVVAACPADLQQVLTRFCWVGYDSAGL